MEGQGVRIDLPQYLMGRDALYPQELTDTIRICAEKTVEKVNSLLAVLETEGVKLEANPQTGSIVSSGWRPPQINGQVKGAAVRSKHMTGQACDLFDPDGLIDDWLMTEAGQRALASIGLWMENPAATKNWSHVQTIPPASGRRCFFP